ncbi:hypothetical protein HN670_01525 [bacterium]|jgi:ABC-type enterobactin transport system permease subunit|nr:hypothetical protein [bacterium]
MKFKTKWLKGPGFIGTIAWLFLIYQGLLDMQSFWAVMAFPTITLLFVYMLAKQEGFNKDVRDLIFGSAIAAFATWWIAFILWFPLSYLLGK